MMTMMGMVKMVVVMMINDGDDDGIGDGNDDENDGNYGDDVEDGDRSEYEDGGIDNL